MGTVGKKLIVMIKLCMLVYFFVTHSISFAQNYERTLTFDAAGQTSPNLIMPGQIAVDNEGSMYVASPFSYEIRKYTPAGVLISTWPCHFAHDVIWGQDNLLYASTTGSVQVFKKDGVLVREFPIGAEGWSRSIAFDPQGNIVTHDWRNGRIYKYSTSGQYLGGFTIPIGSLQGQVQSIMALDVDSKGNIYIVDELSATISKFDSSGTFILRFGSEGTGDGQWPKTRNMASYGWHSNEMIAIGKNDIVYIGDWNNPDSMQSRVQIFTPSGEFIEKFTDQLVGPGNLMFSGIFELPDGRLIISESGDDNRRELAAISIYARPDNTSPTSTFSASPSTTWSNTDVASNITASDNAGGKGVKEIHYTVNMGAEQVVTGSSASFTLTEEGIHSIAYWALDNANNVEATKYATVRIDKTAPTVDGYVVSGKLMLMASDSRSGVAGIKYSLDGAAAADYSAPLTIPAGAHTYSYRSIDLAGNESVKETILVGATVTVTFTPTSVYASKAAVATIRLSVAAPAGGVTVMLASDNPAVTIAPSVKFNAGATTINVPVQTGAVAADTSAVITASVGGTEAYGTLTVLVPFPKTLTVAPNVITGGNSAVGTITLQSNAPAGGQVVTLVSKSVDVIVPATVTVPAGAISATFPVTTKISSVDYSAAIYAEADGAGVGTTVLVKRVTPKSITFAPPTVPGGNASVGTVTLNVAAPAGGAVVQLKSTSTFVTVPTSVTVAEGQTTATFDIATSVTPRTVLANVQATAAGVRVAGVLTVSGVNVTSITLAPNSVLGGTSTIGTVNLNTSAPTGGLTVQLYTSTGIAGVPTSVTVLAGQKTATFTVTTVPVSVSAQTQIVGKYLGVAKTATLTVQAAAVSTVTLNPTSVKGGTNSTLTIKLTGLAGPSGLVVTLASSNLNAATVPATVTVPAGTDTVDVVVTTKVVTANTTSTLTAKTSASSKTVVLTVTK